VRGKLHTNEHVENKSSGWVGPVFSLPRRGRGGALPLDSFELCITLFIRVTVSATFDPFGALLKIKSNHVFFIRL